ncbi:MAG: sigma-70 family RNA polymerase sigma factor [Verrucomicrobiota bacterium]
MKNSHPSDPDLLGQYEQLRAYLRHSDVSENDALDLIQEGYRKFFEYREHHFVEKESGLLFMMVRNLMLDLRRRRRVRREETMDPAILAARVEEDSAIGSEADRIELRERVYALEKAIAELPERCREVFILHRFGGMKYSEIADHLGISQSTIEKHMKRALAACRVAASKS